MKLTLHVGLKKTATSTLQHAFAVGKPQLAAAGLMFPGKAEDHQRVARRVRAGKIPAARAVLSLLASEARDAGLRQVLLSSEHLISIPEMALERLRDLIAEVFPEVTQIRVLAYVREPVSFATSMCQQDVKNGITRLEAFMADPWRFPIADWLAAHVRVFGREQVEVRGFHPTHLAGGDILRDVERALGLPDGILPALAVRRNPALSAEAVLVADALAGLRPGPKRDRMWRSAYRTLLGKIAGARFVLPAPVQERVIAASQGDLAYLRAEFGLDMAPEPVADFPRPDLTPEAARALALKIVKQVEG